MHLKAVFCTGQHTELVEHIQRFRKAVFVDRQGWDLHVEDDREVDAYDSRDAIHLALFQDGEIRGSFRATRTDRPYMAADVFPQLAASEPYPRRADTWEISRFGVSSRGDVEVARITYGLMLWWALQAKAASLVAVTELAHERFLRALGITTRRFGNSGVVGWSDQGRPLLAVAGEIPLARQSGDVLSLLFSHLDDVEIIDVANAFRSARLSA